MLCLIRWLIEILSSLLYRSWRSNIKTTGGRGGTKTPKKRKEEREEGLYFYRFLVRITIQVGTCSCSVALVLGCLLWFSLSFTHLFCGSEGEGTRRGTRNGSRGGSYDGIRGFWLIQKVITHYRTFLSLVIFPMLLLIFKVETSSWSTAVLHEGVIIRVFGLYQ